MNARICHVEVLRGDEVTRTELAGKAKYVVGRSRKADVTLDLDGISRLHIEIEVRDNGIFVKDLGSVNGTKLNDNRLHAGEVYPVAQGDRLMLGLSPFVVRVAFADNATANSAPAKPIERDLKSKIATEFTLEQSELPQPVAVKMPEADDLFSSLIAAPAQAQLKVTQQEIPQFVPSPDFVVPSPQSVVERKPIPPSPRVSRGDVFSERESILARARDEARQILQQAESSVKELRSTADRHLKLLKLESERQRTELQNLGLQTERSRGELQNVELEKNKKTVELQGFDLLRKKLGDELSDLGRLIQDEKSRYEKARELVRSEMQKGEDERNHAQAQHNLEIQKLRDEKERMLNDRSEWMQKLSDIETQHKIEVGKFDALKTEELEKKQALLELGNKAYEVTRDVDLKEKRIRTLEETLTFLEEQKATSDARLVDLKTQVADAEKRYASDKEDFETRSRKIHAELETHEEEFKLKKVRLEVAIEELLTQKMTLDREVKHQDQTLVDARTETLQLNKQKLSLVEDIARLSREADESKDRAAQVFANTAKIENDNAQVLKDFRNAEKEILSLQEQRKRIYAENVQMRRSLEDEMAQSRAQIEDERKAMKLEVDRERERMTAKIFEKEKTVLDLANAQGREVVAEFEAKVEEMKNDLDARLESEEKSYFEAFEGRKTQADRDLVEKRVHLEDEFKRRQNKEDELRESRKKFEIKELVRLVAQEFDVRSSKLTDPLLKASFEEGLKPRIEALVEQVLWAGHKKIDERALSMMPVGPQNHAELKKYWISVVYKYVLPGGFLLLFVASSGFRSALLSPFRKMIQSQEANNEAYLQKLQEERAKKPKYTPKRDRDFRDSYVDNVLYLENYFELKMGDEMYKKWVIELNQFLINELNLEEKAVIKFTTLEGSLVKELLRQRESLNPQFVESGLARMKEAEKEAWPELVDVVGTEKRYLRVRAFEQAFVDKNFYK
jgi:pSer/pThr/pTyr-binding forkhead associated (FHA) protein